MAYPANLSFKRQKKSSQLWAFFSIFPVKYLYLWPHFLMLYGLQMAAGVVGVAGIFVVLFTGKYPKTMEEFIINTEKWRWRVGAYVLAMTDEYPPLKFTAEYPAKVTFAHEKKSSQLWALLTLIPVKFIILIPQIAVLTVMGIVGALFAVIGWIGTIFMGKYPKMSEDIMVTIAKYSFRVRMYVFCLTDKYPPIAWWK